jgi:hypothetical protein
MNLIALDKAAKMAAIQNTPLLALGVVSHEGAKNSGAKHPAISRKKAQNSQNPAADFFCAFCAFLRQKIPVLFSAGGSRAPRPKRAESLRPST